MEKMKKKISIMCCLALIVAFLCPSGAFASIIGQQDLHSDVDKVMQYINIDEDGRIIFDEEEAKNNNETDEIIQIGLMTEEITDAYYLYEHQNSNGRVNGVPSIPVYGNWCGPSYGSGTPIDYLDAACQWHDFCYQDFGDFSCYCDSELLDRIDRDYHLMGVYEQQMAKAVAAAFSAIMLVNGCY